MCQGCNERLAIIRETVSVRKELRSMRTVIYVSAMVVRTLGGGLMRKRRAAFE